MSWAQLRGQLQWSCCGSAPSPLMGGDWKLSNSWAASLVFFFFNLCAFLDFDEGAMASSFSSSLFRRSMSSSSPTRGSGSSPAALRCWQPCGAVGGGGGVAFSSAAQRLSAALDQDWPPIRFITCTQLGTDFSSARISTGQHILSLLWASLNCLNFSRSPGGSRRRADVWPSLLSLCCAFATASASLSHFFSSTRWHSTLQHANM
mmetsp:Transcript_102844/g.291243  ORF Transcript_102844/g.291243 Transcript_102844/m.291243 type:complete len:205 (+) Transcript_102844:278-892(+)